MRFQRDCLSEDEPSTEKQPSVHKKSIHRRVYESARHHATSESGRLYLKSLAAYAAITLILFWYITVGAWNTVPNGGGDVYQSMWSLWWVPTAIFSFHVNPYFTNLLYFPVGANLVTETLMPLAGILTAPLQIFGLPFTYDAIFFLGFMLSGLFTFILTYKLTGNKYASFIAGLIFAFSPMHIAQSMGHLNWASIEFVPLFALALLLMLREKKVRYMVLASVSIVLVNFFGDLLQGIELFLFMFLLLIMFVIMKEYRKEIINFEFAKLFAGMLALAAILGSPFLIPIAFGALQPGVVSSANQLSGVTHNMLWSNNLASFFIPSFYNPLLNFAAVRNYASLYGLTYQGVSYTPDVNEKISYLGYSVLALMLVALLFDYKSHRLKNTLPWIVIGIVFAWLSLGPYVQVMGNVTGIPSLYLLYRDVPILNLLREPGRFDLIATLCFAIIAAIGFDYLTKNRGDREKRIYAAIFAAVIIIEYVGLPIPGNFVSSLSTNAAMPAAYPQIGEISGNFSVLMLPALANISSSAPELYPGLEMYYQTAMRGKPIVGGYTSRYNTSQYQSTYSIPLVVSASYLQAGDGFVYPSPILENATNASLIWLASYNVQFISMIRSAYNYTNQGVLYNYLYGVFGQPVYSSNTTFVFSTKSAVFGDAGKALTAYTAGTWTPGYSFCSQYCNSTIGSMWWGDNVRGIVIYSPTSGKVRIGMKAMSYSNSTPLYLYLNNTSTARPKMVGELGLNSTPSSFNASFNISAGFNQLVLFTPNSTAVPSQYFLFGAKNITISMQSK